MILRMVKSFAVMVVIILEENEDDNSKIDD